MLGMRLNDVTAATNGTTPTLFASGINFASNSINPIGATEMQYSDNDITGELYRCHLCSYTGTSKFHFNAHMNTHFDHKCPFCDYTSRTEGRLKRHIRDFHSEVPPDSWAGTRVLKENNANNGEERSLDSNDANDSGSGGGSAKLRTYKCKQCEFVATCKQNFWDHSKEHIKSEKLLTCPKCNFVTEYKHHLEYHLRNHFGSKPFKCAKCNYSCVNKSMLNSHMKSHSNIYQYRCADCSYATKYCHSLKLHLRKYSHKPATVLNLDGTPNPYPVIDVYGTRRGPRPKRVKQDKNRSEQSLPQTPLSPNLITTTPIPPLIPTSLPIGFPFAYPSSSAMLAGGIISPQLLPQIPHLQHQLHNHRHHNHSSHSLSTPNATPCQSSDAYSNQSSRPNSKLKCNICEFSTEYSTEIKDLSDKHVLVHLAMESKQQNAIMQELSARQSPNSKKFLEQIAANPSLFNNFFAMNSLPKNDSSLALEWYSPKESKDSQENAELDSQLLTKSDDNISISEPFYSSENNALSPRSHSSESSDDDFDLDEQECDDEEKSFQSETTPLDLSSNKNTLPLINDDIEPKNLPFVSQLSNTMTNSNAENSAEKIKCDNSDESINVMNNNEAIDDEQRISDNQPIGPLEQLQNALERYSGMFGLKLNDLTASNGNSPLFANSINFASNSNPTAATEMQYSDNDITGELYRCHLCSYTGTSKFHFNAHMNTHFDHKCPFCDYTSRTEGRLKRHIRDFHSEVPPDSWAGTRVLKENSTNDGEEKSLDSNDANDSGSGGGSSKSRVYKCKQCDFVVTCKQEFWDHSKEHIKSEKLLTCPKCNFVTEYKHHLEYHLRNHFGSKPFKCAKCNYSCVNKSMLNSHMKSHSNIYQYRCADCSYATKYCHSLKLHLRKYSHKPATVLNLDGTPNPYPVIDVYGSRRGPRPKRVKQDKNRSEQSLPQTPLLPNLVSTPPIPPLIPTSLPMCLPFTYPSSSAMLAGGLMSPQFIPQLPHLQNPLHNHTSNLFSTPNATQCQSSDTLNNHSSRMTNKFKCNICEFSTEIKEVFDKHLLMHVAIETQQQNAIMQELSARQSPNSKKFLEQIATNPSIFNNFFAMNSLSKTDSSAAMEWHSPQERKELRENAGLESQLMSKSVDNLLIADQFYSRENPVLSPQSQSSDSSLDNSDMIENANCDEDEKSIHSETIPLDLSSNKNTLPLSNDNNEPKNLIFDSQLTSSQSDSEAEFPAGRRQQLVESPSIHFQAQHRSTPHDSQQLQQQSRAQRRKGRAYKLNVNRVSLKLTDSDSSDEFSDDD